MKYCLLLAAALIATPAAAQDVTAPAAPAVAPIDPLRLDAAHAVIDQIFPTGTYARLMDKTLDTVMGTVMDSVGKLPMRDLARIGGLSETETAELDDTSLKEMMAIMDPVFDRRMQLITTTMMGQMTQLVTKFEPGIRDGLTAAYARRFTPQQLNELHRFFATPTGAIYASESMLLFMDPEVMARMQEMMPEMMKEMPAIMAAVETEMAALPKPRTYADLTKAERGKLAQLLGISEAELAKRQKKGSRAR